jgi:hypothetical protein
MAAIIGVGGIFAALFTAALSGLFAEELRAWIPRMIESTIRHAVDQLRAGQRERYAEEWRSHINQMPGQIGKFAVAVGFLLAARRMASIGKLALASESTTSKQVPGPPVAFTVSVTLGRLKVHGEGHVSEGHSQG